MSTFTIAHLADGEDQAFFVSENDLVLDSFDTLAEAEAFIAARWRVQALNLRQALENLVN